jgi:hypothetical protein
LSSPIANELEMEHEHQAKLARERANRSESESEEDFMNNAAKKYDVVNPVLELILKLYQLPFPKLSMLLRFSVLVFSLSLCLLVSAICSLVYM